MILFYAGMFVFGTIIGSFLNVVILRLGTGRGLGGRSACATCTHSLCWYELVPVFSWIFLRGRCRACRARISAQYPVVEAVMGIVMMYIGYRVIPTVLFSPELTILYILFSIVFASLLLILTVYDIRHKVLPSVALYPLVVLSVVSMFVHGYGVAVPTLGDMLAGVLVSLPVFLLFFFSKGRAVGFADGVLLLGLGFVVGLSGAILGFFLSYWLALAYALPFLLTGTLSRKSQIPFAPFIIVAFSIVFVSGWGIDNLIALFTLYL